MARPRKEGMDYFPHDTDAVNDEKIEALRALFGNDGYAFYFILLERIYRTSSFELDISDAETIQILSKKISVTEELFTRMLEASLKRGCFDRRSYDERRVLTSSGIKKRASVVIEKRESMRIKYRNECEEQEVISESETTPETPPQTPQSKVKKSKEKKSKEVIYTHDELEILSLWNSKEIIRHNESKPLKETIAKALKDYGKEMIELSINHYSNVLESEFYYSHKFTLINFFKQKNGMPNFLDNGEIWINFLDSSRVKKTGNIGRQGGKTIEEPARNSERWKDDPYIKAMSGTK